MEVDEFRKLIGEHLHMKVRDFDITTRVVRTFEIQGILQMIDPYDKLMILPDGAIEPILIVPDIVLYGHVIRNGRRH